MSVEFCRMMLKDQPHNGQHPRIKGEQHRTFISASSASISSRTSAIRWVMANLGERDVKVVGVLMRGRHGNGS